MLHSVYAYFTSSMLGLHDIIIALLVTTLIAITFSINKKWKTDNKQFVSDILMLRNEEVNNIPYSCFYLCLQMNIFEDGHKKYKHMKNIHKWIWAFNWNIIFFGCQVFDLQLHFFVSDRFRCWKMRTENCWETQSKQYLDIYKNISHLSWLCFFLEKDFIWETDVGKTKCNGI